MKPFRIYLQDGARFFQHKPNFEFDTFEKALEEVRKLWTKYPTDQHCILYYEERGHGKIMALNMKELNNYKLEIIN